MEAQISREVNDLARDYSKGIVSPEEFIDTLLEIDEDFFRSSSDELRRFMSNHLMGNNRKSPVERILMMHQFYEEFFERYARSEL